MLFRRLFLAHPQSVGETYFEHQRRALGFAGDLIVAGLCCTLHGLVPGVCVRSASDTVIRLHAEMAGRRTPRAATAAAITE